MQAWSHFSVFPCPLCQGCICSTYAWDVRAGMPRMLQLFILLACAEMITS